MTDLNRAWILSRRPAASHALEACFELVEKPVPDLADGEVLVRNHFLSVDPYMRGRMDDIKSYAEPQALGAVMQGGTVGVVARSRNPRFAQGDAVVGRMGWQEWGVSDGSGMGRVDASRIALSAYLGVAGMPGITAWIGLKHLIEPKEGQTVAVSAASGAVGSVVGQLAKQMGCRVVGIAGGAEKCRLVTEGFGFDACIDYKAGGLDAALKAACPQGIDGYFENVGGPILDAALKRMNAFGRIAVCGLIAGYNGEPIPVNNIRSILVNRLRMQGFIVTEFPKLWPVAQAELVEAVAANRLRYHETVAQGIEAAPSAFTALLRGGNIGKQLVKLI
jgi:NADPH-dependent curcumin reductase CurA